MSQSTTTKLKLGARDTMPEDLCVLAADIGASNSRFRLARTGGEHGTYLEVIAEERADSSDTDVLKERLREFARRQMPPGGKLGGIAIGLPGKVSPDRQSAAPSYLDPDLYIPFDDLFAELGAPGVLLNDLESGAFGLAATSPEHLEPLCGTGEPRGDRALLGMPGTGFGIGILVEAGEAIPSEGGHVLAAIDSTDPIERRCAELARLEEGYTESMPVPTWEDVLRGRAVARAFQAVVEVRASEERGARSAADDLLERLLAVPARRRPEAVSSWARDLADDLGDAADRAGTWAREAFRVYGRFLGRALQGLTLAMLPGTAYLGGTIVLENRDLIAESFADAFRAHPVHDGHLRTLPVRIVDNPSLNLDGASRKALLICGL